MRSLRPRWPIQRSGGRLAEECADVLLYLLLICELAGIELGTAAAEKMSHNAAKYPVDKARGNSAKYTEL